MDIQKEREAFEESNNVKPDWSFKFDEELQQYIALDSEMELQVDEFNELWDAFRAGWQAAKAQAVPEGFVVVPKEPTQELLNKMQDYFVGAFANGLTGGQSIHCAYKAMIEAQEQAND